MGYFIFIGDMLVMLFMTCLVTWVFVWSSKDQVDASANIPLNDELESGISANSKKPASHHNTIKHNLATASEGIDNHG